MYGIVDRAFDDACVADVHEYIKLRLCALFDRGAISATLVAPVMKLFQTSDLAIIGFIFSFSVRL